MNNIIEQRTFLTSQLASLTFATIIPFNTVFCIIYNILCLSIIITNESIMNDAMHVNFIKKV